MTIQGPIFNNSIKKVDAIIVSYTNNVSLLSLSGVNHQAHKVLSNDFFKHQFYKTYPCLLSYKIFKNLQEYHPHNCWKIACRYIGVAKLSTPFGVEKHLPTPSYVFEEAAPLIKAKLEFKIKEICGSCHEDPNSPINKAWEAFASCRNLKLVKQETAKLCQSVGMIEHEKDLEKFRRMNKMSADFNEEAEHALLTNPGSPSNAPVIILTMKHLQECNHIEELKLQYDKLERKAIKNVTLLEEFDVSAKTKHFEKLDDEIRFAKEIVHDLRSSDLLTVCVSLMQEFIDSNKEPSPTDRENMQNLIWDAENKHFDKSSFCLSNLPITIAETKELLNKINEVNEFCLKKYGKTPSAEKTKTN